MQVDRQHARVITRWAPDFGYKATYILGSLSGGEKIEDETDNGGSNDEQVLFLEPAMALTISAITKKIGTPTKSNHTLYNTGSSTIYIHTDITKTGFVGNAAELLVLSEIELQAGESVTIDQTLNDVLAVCATGESSTLRKAAGDLRPFEPNVYGEISAVSNSTETVIVAQGTAVQVLIFDTNGCNNRLTPDHTNDHLTIVDPGCYKIDVAATVNSVGGAGSRFEMTVRKNNGSTQVGALHVDRNIEGGGGSSGSVSMTGLADLVAGDTLEVWVENETNTANYILEDIVLTAIRIAPTT